MATNLKGADRKLAQIWGAQVRDLRGEIGITQEQFEEMSGIPQQTLSRLERGQFVPSLQMLLRLADGLGRDPEHVFTWPTREQLRAA